jgi:hypothetical protein
MIMDTLELPYESVSGNPDSAMRLIEAYPYIPGRRADNPGILYLASWEQLRGSEVYPKNVICIGGGADSHAFCDEREITGLIFGEDCQPLSVLREIQEIFTKYNNLERALLDALITKAPLLDVLNACACFLECQVSLFDVDFNLLEYSDNFPPGDDDVIWKKTIEAKRSVLPMFPREKVKMLPCNPVDFPRSTFLDVGGDVRPHLNIGFDYGDNRIATLIFWEVGKPITSSYLWLADYIADTIRPLIMERYNTFRDVRNQFRTCVATALRYSTMDSTFLHVNLAHLGWRPGDDYQIILVQLPPEDRRISHSLYNYENVFAGAYSDCIALRHEDFILLLLHNDACSMLEQCLPALRKQLSMDGGVCSVGLRFCDLAQLTIEYDMTKLPLRISSQGNRRIRFYREVMETHLINELSSCFPLRHTCHYAAVRVQEYDIANGTDFLLTLETYLMNNKSLMAAAEKLFIHRSTLTYRLKCIEKIARMQLDDPCERLHILLSCIVLRIIKQNSAPTGAHSVNQVL